MDIAMAVWFYVGIGAVIAYAGKQVWDSWREGEWDE